MTAVGLSSSGFASSSRSASRPPLTVNAECATSPSLSRAARRASRCPIVFSRARQRVRVTGDEADPLVPELDEVLRRDPTGCTLVDAHRRHVEILRAAVHEDEPRALARGASCSASASPRTSVISAEMRQHPLDATLEEHAHVVALASRRSVGAAEDRGEPAPRGVHLHRLGECGEDRVRELRDEEPDRARRLDPAGRDVQELAHRALDPVAGLGTDGRRAACDARGGCDANSARGRRRL